MARALTELSPLELLEQSVAVLRAVPASAWNYYVAGAAPLLVAAVYGIARVSVRPMAAEEIGIGSFVLAGLFLWMSWAKIRFARALYAQLASEPLHSITASWPAAAMLGTQLIVVPLSLLAIFPFAWSVAFYGNITAVAQRPGVFRESARMAGLYQRQNWCALGLVAVFALVVFLNVAILLGLLPILARMFSGLENEFTRNPGAMLNATFAATAVGVTWFLIDPLVQAMYVVRCFKGYSVGSGADLKAALRRLVFGLTLACVTSCTVQARPINPGELDAKIRHTLQSPEYSWQNPETVNDDSPRWLQDAAKFTRWIGHGIRVALDWIAAWLRDVLGSQHANSEAGKAPPRTSLRWSIYGALGLIAILTFLILRRAFATRGSTPSAARTAPIDPQSDVLASELPEDEWMRLAREALERGDLRQALRAAYLANLAWLGSTGLVAISRYKSNRDYEREVRLRGRSDEITALLKANREIFESAWYGDESKSADEVEDMRRNLVRMRELHA